MIRKVYKSGRFTKKLEDANGAEQCYIKKGYTQES